MTSKTKAQRPAAPVTPSDANLRFGIARADITPPFPTTMGGYAARQDHFDRVNDPLSAEVLILENNGARLVIVTADLITFEDEQAVDLRHQIAEITKTSAECVLLNASHTHGGPEMRDKAVYFRSSRDTSSSSRYRQWLQQQLLDAVAQAAQNLAPGSLWLGCGKTAVNMNRRLERNGEIVNAPNPDGPVDDRLQVLALRNQEGQIRALGIRLSCHPVATGAQHLITADFPGAFKKACADALGADVMPFFLQGAGGDMRPAAASAGDRWRQLDHAELPAIGRQLLHETLAVLHQPHGLEQVIPGAFRGAYVEAEAPCERLYTTREDFVKLQQDGPPHYAFYPTRALARLDAGLTIPDRVKIGVQTLWLNDDLAIIGIQGEVLIGLGEYVEKSLLPKKAILLGYCNGCVSYLPDSHEVKRGGYEQMGYLYSIWTGPYKPGLEKTIAKAVTH